MVRDAAWVLSMNLMNRELASHLANERMSAALTPSQLTRFDMPMMRSENLGSSWGQSSGSHAHVMPPARLCSSARAYSAEVGSSPTPFGLYDLRHARRSR